MDDLCVFCCLLHALLPLYRVLQPLFIVLRLLLRPHVLLFVSVVRLARCLRSVGRLYAFTSQ